MIRRVLIANRGEIAVRVIRACRDLGVETVAVYSEADADSLPVAMADRAVCIGPPPARRSYLDAPAVLAAALGTGCDAVHPGYGFLSENAAFAAACAEVGLVFIGPTPPAIARLGDKVAARRTVAAEGVPLVPGSDGVLDDPGAAEALVRSIGFPVLLKARGGGGGRGMRVVRTPDGFRTAWSEAAGEAGAAFADSGLYVERYLERVRHVEVQVLADTHGRTVALGERDCTVQRRHQKLIEEAPSPALDPDLRQRIAEAGIRAARSVDYVGAGTVEFLFDVETRAFYFIEMNARIQVEHPVTEMRTGVDLVAEQIRIAGGLPMSDEAASARSTGHAIECRVNAEDPAADFAPSPGVVSVFHPPGGPGVRVDSHCRPGYRFPPNYDSLLAKLIVHGADRDQAVRRMRRALGEFVIEGVATTIPYHLQVLNHPAFVAGDVTTRFVEEMAAQSAGGRTTTGGACHADD